MDQHKNSQWEIHEERETDDIQVIVRDESLGIGKLTQKLVSLSKGGELGTHRSNNENQEAKSAYSSRLLTTYPMMFCENSRGL